MFSLEKVTFNNPEFSWIEFQLSTRLNSLKMLIDTQESSLKEQIEEYEEKKKEVLKNFSEEDAASYEYSNYYITDIEFVELTYIQRNSICLMLYSIITVSLESILELVCKKIGESYSTKERGPALKKYYGFIKNKLKLKETKELESTREIIFGQIFTRNAIAHTDSILKNKNLANFEKLDGLTVTDESRVFISDYKYLFMLIDTTVVFFESLILSLDEEL